MTTATAPPLTVPAVDVDDMPALDQPDERECEFWTRDDVPCYEPAAWALTFREICGCNDSERSCLLACDECHGQVEDNVQAAQCMTCLRYVPLLRAELL